MKLLVCLALTALLAQPLQEVPGPANSSNEKTPAAETEAALRERVTRWWDARVAQDRRAMYDLYSPEYRAEVDYEDFIAESAVRHRIPVLSHSILEIELEGERARVLLDYRVVAGPFPGIQSRFLDEWVRDGGEWFRVYKPPVPPFQLPTPPAPGDETPSEEPEDPESNLSFDSPFFNRTALERSWPK